MVDQRPKLSLQEFCEDFGGDASSDEGVARDILRYLDPKEQLVRGAAADFLSALEAFETTLIGAGLRRE